MDDADLNILKQDHANLLQAVRFGLHLPTTLPAAITLLTQLVPLIERGGHWLAWLPILKPFKHPISAIPSRTHFALLNCYGQFLRLGYQLEQAVYVQQRALELAAELGDSYCIAEAEYQLSITCRLQHLYDQAEKLATKALLAFRQLALCDREAAAINGLALIEQSRGNWAAAETWFQLALHMPCVQRSCAWQARILNNVAINRQKQKDYQTALLYYQQAVAQLDVSVKGLDYVRIYLSLGALYFDMQHWQEAEQIFLQIHNWLRTVQWPYYQAIVCQSLGNVLLKQRRFDQSFYYLSRSLSLWQSLESNTERANTLGTLGKLFQEREQHNCARGYYCEAIGLLSKSENGRERKLWEEFTSALSKL